MASNGWFFSQGAGDGGDYAQGGEVGGDLADALHRATAGGVKGADEAEEFQRLNRNENKPQVCCHLTGLQGLFG
jgi:hypothetical protein